MNWGSSAAGQADVYQVTGTVMEHQTAWMTLMNTTAVSYSFYHISIIGFLRGLEYIVVDETLKMLKKTYKTKHNIL